MAISFLGLIFGDDGSGWSVPTYAEIRSAAGKWVRGATNTPNLNLEPKAFFGVLTDYATSVIHSSAQIGLDVLNALRFTTASGENLGRILSPVTVRIPARASAARVYVYGAEAATVIGSSIVRTSTTAPAFAFLAGVTVPAPAAAVAWVFEIAGFAVGAANGETFTLTVDGSPVAVLGTALDTPASIRASLLSQLNALTLSQVGYLAGTSPTTGRLAGAVREDGGGGPFPVTFTVAPTAALGSLYTAIVGATEATTTGPIPAPAESLRYGQNFPGIVGYVNLEAAALGRIAETDSQLKARHLLTQRRGFGNPDAIKSAVLTPVEFGGAGATYCAVEYNSDSVVNGVGNLPHSVRVVVDTDVDPQVVAAVVWTYKAAGDNTNGIDYFTPDAEVNLQLIRLDFLETIYVWCDVEVERGDGWPVVGDPAEQLRVDIENFINTRGGAISVRPNEAPVSFLPDGTPRGVKNFKIRFGSSTDPLGLAPPIAYLDYYPDPESDADLATIAISGRQVAETNLGRITAVIL